jgi:hypothetical protein
MLGVAFLTRRSSIYWAENSASPAEIPQNTEPLGGKMRHQPEDAVGLGNWATGAEQMLSEAGCRV